MLIDARELFSKFTYGLYALTSVDCACIIDTAMQITSSKEDEIFLCLAINNESETGKIIYEGNNFAINIMSKNTTKKVIEQLGTGHSSEKDKFKGLDTKVDEDTKVLVGKESLGYLICRPDAAHNCGTHTWILAKVLKAKVLDKETEPLTYNDYKEM